jgi:acyl-CoA synthetase (AMP-forming)/AMP-acid ligase II
LIRPHVSVAFAEDTDVGERIVIAVEVERKNPADVALQEVAQSIRREISEQHGVSVSSVLLLKPFSIPRTSSGKVQRQACRAAYLEKTIEPLVKA